jgi:Lar family restriction alleviation protein
MTDSALYCPICGSRAFYVSPHNFQWDKDMSTFRVECDHCLARTREYNTREDALKAWNNEDLVK